MSDLPELTGADITLLFDWDFYDGPLSGGLDWEGRRYWFSAVLGEGWPVEPPAFFEVRDLAAGQWALIDDLNALFERHVVPGVSPEVFYEDERVKAWKDPEGEIVATLDLYGKTPASCGEDA
ncbi:hypothetical protein [Nonomuraea typhae]|uniref:Uncharacterized protein n=1 Tax=Nonomuraea typhae TaxID=2603600 RepID=A0ABW7YLV3_9ACTN